MKYPQETAQYVEHGSPTTPLPGESVGLGESIVCERSRGTTCTRTTIALGLRLPMPFCATRAYVFFLAWGGALPLACATHEPPSPTDCEASTVDTCTTTVNGREVSSTGRDSASSGDALPMGSTGPVDKVDLLLMLDNSGSMSDKQDILQLAVPDLIEQLVLPRCVDAQGVVGTAVDTSTGQCVDGFRQEFVPLQNVNIAVITSSLGDAGADSFCDAGRGGDVADMAHTIGSLPRGAIVESNNSELGFLEWRPGTELERFTYNVASMVGAVGEAGCGYENSLESWYRFLVDPQPYRELERVSCSDSDTSKSCVQPTSDGNGDPIVDEVLLAQRDAFLRPDSALAVVMLTDENDCSVQIGQQTWLMGTAAFEMFRATSVCEDNPNDRCCRTCSAPSPDGCAEDPICDANPETGAEQNRLSVAEDSLILRCFRQKQRFGADLLYPTRRYVHALTQRQLCTTKPDLNPEGCVSEDIVDNPLFRDGARSPGDVIFAGIIGVPYQSIASTVDATGEPLQGDEADSILRFKSWQQLTDDGDWDKILGSVGVPYDADNPAQSGVAPTPPSDLHMVESLFERPGIGPNTINGREWDTTASFLVDGAPSREDLQYACIFRLPEPRDCSEVEDGSCDCRTGGNNKPLCEEVPGTSVPGTTQYWAKAYPGLRHLEVLKGYGENAVLASICASNLSEPSRADYGYRPAVTAIVERLRLQFDLQ